MESNKDENSNQVLSEYPRCRICDCAVFETGLVHSECLIYELKTIKKKLSQIRKNNK